MFHIVISNTIIILLETWIVGAVSDIENAGHVAGGGVLHLLKQRLKISTFRLPELDLHHRAGVLPLLQLLLALHAEDLVHLMSPLDNDSLDVVLHEEVDVLPVALPDLPLFVLDVGGGPLGEGQQSLALDVTSDLVNGRLQLVNLSLDIWSNRQLLNVSLYLSLLPSPTHCGNLEMLFSFLNIGMMTSSTQAQKWSASQVEMVRKPYSSSHQEHLDRYPHR